MHYELSAAARAEVIKFANGAIPVSFENKNFTPPVNGDMWLKFDYMEADTQFLSLDRKCKSYIGLVQIGVIVMPGSGADDARRKAKEIADFLYDGKMLNDGYISEGGTVHPMIKHDSGWLIPVRCNVRYDEKRK